MSKMNWKLRFAGVLVAGALGLVAWKFAWATPAFGVSSTPLSGPVALDEIDIVSETRTHGVILKTRGEWETRVVHFRVVPGGDFGWHSHPGPVFVMVTEGTLTLYHADDPTTPVIYPAGTGFVEEPGHENIGRNEADVDLELVAFFLTPLGAAPRTDEPAP